MGGNELIGSTHVLKRRPAADTALAMLQRVSAQVRPIMQQRGWRVKVLREFYPRTANLLGLNVNRGQEIRLRLRSPHDDSRFLEYTDVLGTMLHELVHIERAPHDSEFYRRLDELRRETEELMARGYTGDGFHSDGRRVGQGVSHNAPRHQLREKRLRAAEGRAVAMGGRARTLGGAEWAVKQARYTPAQMAAMALERRLRDERWCGETMPDATAETEADSDDDVVIVLADFNEPIIVVDSDSDSDCGSQKETRAAYYNLQKNLP
ncbi:hypothetical protein H4R20_006664 [Coemansia guatemalensis]|uniref:WLM domain-containing protein n=1 Tax=Coemansia guatemalensis TaxID=2761395 RepID=A0A9W8HVF5_9FUNG|nr:hypothetical protein H4R20_006664 [Coemansia guatemalensis]